MSTTFKNYVDENGCSKYYECYRDDTMVYGKNCDNCLIRIGDQIYDYSILLGTLGKNVTIV